MLSFQELREQLTEEMIKDILIQYDVEPFNETENYIVFPTCCHNINDGSPKLYYYKDSRLFHCFTQCGDTFDIFTLLQRMWKLRGKDITLRQAIEECNLDASVIGDQNFDTDLSCIEEIRRMQVINNNGGLPDVEQIKFKEYDKKILYKYGFDYIGLMPWIQEGISVEALQRFNIKYDSYNNAIVIPNFDYSGKLIGIRERFLREEDIIKGKYRPLCLNGEFYNHPTGRTFYGIFENHAIIEKSRTAIIFEGEKSVLLYGSIYGNDKNIALATLGQNITNDHIQYLNKMNVRRVILAYDTDYEDNKELLEKEQKYIAKAKILSPYFNVSVIMDYDMILPYKSSPIDGGKEIFEKLLTERRFIQ